MNSNLTYPLAMERIADLARSAEQTRRTKNAIEPSKQGTRSTAGTVIRLRLGGGMARRLRVRRA